MSNQSKNAAGVPASTEAAEVAAPSGDRPKAGSSLLEKDMVRFAISLDDFEHVSVTDMGGWGPDRYWVVVHDHRFDIDYEITSHSDYWDVISALERSSLAFGCVLGRQRQKSPLLLCVRHFFSRQGRSVLRTTDRRNLKGVA